MTERGKRSVVNEKLSGADIIRSGGTRRIEMVTNTCALCDATASQKCGGCQSVYYCSREHQKTDWAKHKGNCKPYKVCDNDVLGRHLVATRDMKPGEIVLKESPLLWGPSQVTGPVCLSCLKSISEEDSKPCPRCGWPLCLDASCGHSVQHRPECQWAVEKRKAQVRISQFITPHPTYECITVLRMLYLRDNNKPLWEKLNRLQSHCAERRNTYKYEKDKSMIAQFLRRFYKLEKDFTEEEILRICGIIEVNGHEVPTTDPPHVAIFDVASMLEHSCVPNCTKSFTRLGHLVIRTAGPVSQGDHLSICYTDALWGTPSRRHHLQETKFFSCCCSRCSDPTEMGTYFSALLCQSCGSQSTMLPESFMQPIDEQVWKCKKCGGTMDTSEIGTLLDSAGRELATLSSSGIEESKRYLKRWQQYFHKNHYYLTEAKLALVQRYGEVHPELFQIVPDRDLQYKIDMCRELITLIGKLNPAEFRAIGMLYFELHSALAEKARRLQETDMSSVPENLMESKRCLEKCISYLQHEPPVLPEGIIAEQARTNLGQINVTLASICNVSP